MPAMPPTTEQYWPPETMARVGAASEILEAGAPTEARPVEIDIIAPASFAPVDARMAPGLQRLKAADQHYVSRWAGAMYRNLQGSDVPPVKLAERLAADSGWTIAQQASIFHGAPVLAFAHLTGTLFDQLGVVWNERRPDQAGILSEEHRLAIGGLMLERIERCVQRLGRSEVIVGVKGYHADTRSKQNFFMNVAGMEVTKGAWGKRGAQMTGVASHITASLRENLGIDLLYYRPTTQPTPMVD